MSPVLKILWDIADKTRDKIYDENIKKHIQISWNNVPLSPKKWDICKLCFKWDKKRSLGRTLVVVYYMYIRVISLENLFDSWKIHQPSADVYTIWSF